MTNTVMTAKNTFAEGLVMDFAPDNTQATTLTSALNATLLTFNGNEMSLQNDMGNGRVETAYLPEGYIPVGTCEFGDIIYIVSYNPLLNKSQIGCFPSPERNISSQEIGGLNQSIKWTDFQKSDGTGPNGELVASSVKKVLYKNKDMTSGDKYIIYSSEIDQEGKYLSDYGNTSHQHGRFPKFVKIHVVSIEESGKITYLDSSTKWYKQNNFYIQNQREILDKPDLDSYRTMVSSAYSIFSSKVSGQLALLIELEKISGFSCTWNAYTEQQSYSGDIQNNKYSIYWNFSWETDDFNTNPSAVVLTESKWTGEDSTWAGFYQTWGYNDQKKGWALGGTNQEWINSGITKPISYPDANYYYSEVQRVYKPETYSQNFDTFVKQDSYYAKSISLISNIKQDIKLPQEVELTKVNIAKTNGVPDIGKYYFNCTSTAIENGNTKYYTSWDNKLIPIDSIQVSDDIINNTFSYPITKKFADFTIPIKQRITQNEKVEEKNININNLIYYYELTPAMPYGLLREFSQDGYIDFKKIGTKSIKLNTWKYHNYENTSTLTWGLEAYTEPNKGISEVVFIFYDNQGPAAAYHSTGKSSYNGKFTEYFTLNTSGTNYKLNNKDESQEVFYHKGEAINKDAVIVSGTYLDSDGNPIAIEDMVDGVQYYINDAGTLYSNCLYLVKTIIKYCNVGALGDYIEDQTSYIEDYRWYWTNTMFNDYYYSVQDFKELQFNLSLDVNQVCSQQPHFISKNVEYSQQSSELEDFKHLKANVEYINQKHESDQEGNIDIKLQAGLQNDYFTFNLNKDFIKNISIKTYLGKQYISQSIQQPSVIFSDNQETIFDGIYPINQNNGSAYLDQQPNIGKKLLSLIGIEGGREDNELYSTDVSYKDYTNIFSLEFAKKEDIKKEQSIEYINSQEDESIIIKTDAVTKTLDQIELSSNSSTSLTFTGAIFSKYYDKTKTVSIPCKILRPLICYDVDLEKYNMFFVNGHFYFKTIGGVSIGNDIGGEERIKIRFRRTTADSNGNIIQNFVQIGGINFGKVSYSFLSAKIQNSVGSSLSDAYTRMVPFFIMRESDYGQEYEINRGINDINQPQVNPTSMFQQYFTLSSKYNGGFVDNFSRVNNNNAYIVLAMADVDDKLHLTNCFIPVNWTSSPSISQIVRYDYDAPYKKLTTVGDMIASVLMNLYYTSDQIQTLSYSKIVNFIKLEDYKTYFTKDIINEVTIEEQSNSLLLIRGYNYSDYLQKLKENIKGPVINNNVDVQIHGIIKNCPIQVQFNYKYHQVDQVDPAYAVLCSNGDVIFKNTGFSARQIYYKSPSTDDFFTLSGSMQYYPIINVKYEDSRYIGDYDTTCIYSNPYIKNNFTLKNEQIVCSNTSETIPNYQTFCINGKEHGWSGIWPLNTEESLIINAKYG